MSKHTPGPWIAYEIDPDDPEWGACEIWPAENDREDEEGAMKPVATMVMGVENARLIAAAPTQHEEMLRYLPILERAEADHEIWEKLTEGTGIATANGYRAAIAKATGESE